MGLKVRRPTMVAAHRTSDARSLPGVVLVHATRARDTSRRTVAREVFSNGTGLTGSDVDIVCDMHQCMEICIIMEVHVWNGQQ